MTTRSSATFWALSDPVRIDIVERLTSGSSVTATALAADLPITRQAVARHLATLEEAGLVLHRKQGRETRYQVVTAPMMDAADWLETRAASWDQALTRLSGHLDARASTAE